jgi:hypothetical protein
VGFITEYISSCIPSCVGVWTYLINTRHIN